MIKRVLMAGGGTGGHLFPGLAVVDEIRRRNPEVTIHFVGTERGIEARVIPQRGDQITFLPVTPIKGMSLVYRALSVLRLPMAVLRAFLFVRNFKPDVVIGVGGYASGPVVLAAALAGYPTALLEQNAHVGLTNRLLARVVRRAYVAFQETASLFGVERTCVSGNPIRPAIVETARLAIQDPLGFEAKADTLLIIGGSQGAQALNEVLPQALALLGDDLRGLRVVHQAGAGAAEALQTRYQEAGVSAEVSPFIDDMGKTYARAKLVVSRAGATTLAELSAIGRPSLLIPFPQAADDHQTANAQAFVARDAGRLLNERDMTPERLASEIRSLLQNDAWRFDMARNARSLGRLEAAQVIVDDLYDWLSPQESGPIPVLPASEAPPQSSPHSNSGITMRVSADTDDHSALRPLSSRPPQSRRPAQRRLLLVDGMRWEG